MQQSKFAETQIVAKAPRCLGRDGSRGAEGKTDAFGSRPGASDIGRPGPSV